MGGWNPWDTSSYYWVVICKNKRFHRQANTMFGHKIPLAETDAYAPLPVFNGVFRARCDECGEEYDYEPKGVLRAELALPGNFVPHPLFK